jgi:four helix bundle protein
VVVDVVVDLDVNVNVDLDFSTLTIPAMTKQAGAEGAERDQLVRAAESVVRNIAEGAGRWSDADSAKHYKIARGEAMECAASLDVMRLRKLVAPQQYDRGIRLLEAVVAMLTKMF